VHLRGIGSLVADVIADGLEWHIGVDEPLDARVAKRVRAGTRRLDPRPAQVLTRAGRNRAVRQWGKGGDHSEKDVAIGRRWAARSEVVDDGITHGGRQRV